MIPASPISRIRVCIPGVNLMLNHGGRCAAWSHAAMMSSDWFSSSSNGRFLVDKRPSLLC